MESNQDEGGATPLPEQLLAELYDELRSIARRHLRQERADQTLAPTALVHEVYLSLRSRSSAFSDRSHFLRTASRAMRSILVDHARARQAAKRDGGVRITLNEAIVAGDSAEVDLLALHDALEQLEAAEPRWARVVELRFFAGLDIDEIADALQVSSSTVKRDWRFAKAFLARSLGGDGPTGSRAAEPAGP